MPYDGSGGVNGRAGAIELRDAQIQYPGTPQGAEYAPGQNAPLRLTIINSGDAADRLLKVTSPVATAIEIRGDATLQPHGSLTAGMDGRAAASAAQGERAIAILLLDLREDLRSGINYPVSFTFERGGTLRAELPLESPSQFCTRVPGATVCRNKGPAG